MEELIVQIKEMRAAQNEFHRTKDWQVGQVARVLEQRVDKKIEAYEKENH